MLQYESRQTVSYAAPIATVATPPARPTILYDGSCSFCRRWVARWKFSTGPTVDYEPFQEAAARFPEVPAETFRRRMVLVHSDGHAYAGPAAIFRALDHAGKKRWLLSAYEGSAVARSVTDVVYGFVTRHRPLADRVDRFLLGPDPTPSTYYVTREVFTRGLALVFLIAFASLWSQVHGLIGRHGILPVSEVFTPEVLASNGGAKLLGNFPTLIWLNPTDRMLDLLCGGGVVVSTLALIGILQGPAFFLSWASYLSLTVAGRVFLGYQWDQLLLEAGFLGIFFARWNASPLPRLGGAPPSTVSLWLLRWLLFRLMFLSGVVKLASNDPAWRDWTALNYHLWTQPLPTALAWYAQQLPDSVKSLSVGVTLYVELLVPFLIFGPRRIRRLAFWQLAMLQIVIAATGNYGFFNLLTIVLCVVTLDDTFFIRWSKRLRVKVNAFRDAATVSSLTWFRRRLAMPFAALIVLISIVRIAARFDLVAPWPVALLKVDEAIRPFESINVYGLFATMTKTRPELSLQGSLDGSNWVDYPFRWKPTDPARRPPFCEPHMPRLDWQMWFLSLERPHDLDLLIPLARRLFEGEPAVLSLFEHDPFNGRRPKFIRVVQYNYTFTDPQTRRATGAWWSRGEPVDVGEAVSEEMLNRRNIGQRR